jgi:GNAT superfamily N-acetyltransferase
MKLDAAALYRVLLDATDRRPDSEVIEREGWIQLRTPSSRQVPHNKIIRAVLNEADADRVIAEVLADHRARGASFAWYVDGPSRPRDLSDRLEKAGVPVLGDGIGMVRATRDADAPLPDGLRITEVGPDTVDTYGDVMCRAWPRPMRFAPVLAQFAQKGLDHPEMGLSTWLAWYHDEPLGAAALRLLPSGICYLQGASVMPEVRGRGIYTALMRRRLVFASEAGVEHAVIWANPKTSAPMARALDFEEVPDAFVRFHDTQALSD